MRLQAFLSTIGCIGVMSVGTMVSGQQSAAPPAGSPAPATSAAPVKPSPDMSFFVTSVGSGKGGDLGGLAGADAHCTELANAAGVTGKTWHAYLSQAPLDGKPQVNARDRIGTGPWKNAAGYLVASSVAELHAQAPRLYEASVLSEKGEKIPLNTHDILTGSDLDGTLMKADVDLTCHNWTLSEGGSAQVGHYNRNGGSDNPSSWNSAHRTSGCSVAQLKERGSAGLTYCFAVK
jgi:hypothetical protein